MPPTFHCNKNVVNAFKKMPWFFFRVKQLEKNFESILLPIEILYMRLVTKKGDSGVGYYDVIESASALGGSEINEKCV